MRYTIRDPADAERVLRWASHAARKGRNAVDITSETGVPLAPVWPDGHIDATWEGSRYVSIVPTVEREPS